MPASTIAHLACCRCGGAMSDEDQARCLDRPLCLPCVYAAELEHRQLASTLPVAAALRRAHDRVYPRLGPGADALALAFIAELERS